MRKEAAKKRNDPAEWRELVGQLARDDRIESLRAKIIRRQKRSKKKNGKLKKKKGKLIIRGDVDASAGDDRGKWQGGVALAARYSGRNFSRGKKKKISLELVVASSLTLPVYLFMK